jgi:hypothetical protein
MRVGCKGWAMGVFVAAALSACAEEERRGDRPISEVVRELDFAPELACNLVDSVAVVTSTLQGHAPSTYDLVREYAAEHGANYFAIDQFTVSSDLDPTVTIRARVFSCRPRSAARANVPPANAQFATCNTCRLHLYCSVDGCPPAD